MARWLSILALSSALIGAPAHAGGVRFEVHAFDSAGQPETSFGAGAGSIVVDVRAGGSEDIIDTELDSDGRLVAVGTWISTSNMPDRIAIARLSAAGLPDPSFSGDGKLTVPVYSNGKYARAFDVTHDAQGRILVAGTVSEKSGVGARIVVVRLNADGTYDTTFSGNGKNVIAFTNAKSWIAGRGVAVDSKGRILVAGMVSIGAWREVVVARLLPDGSLDESYGDQGFARDRKGNSWVRQLLVDSHDRAVVIGHGHVGSGGDSIGVKIWRFLPTGALDSSFANGGHFDGSGLGVSGATAMRAFVQTRPIAATKKKRVVAGRLGKAKVAGAKMPTAKMPTAKMPKAMPAPKPSATTDEIVVAGYGRNDANKERYLLFKLRDDGALDGTFGNDGIAFAPQSQGIQYRAWDMLRDPQGRILVAGTYRTGSGQVTWSVLSVLRFSKDGTFDNAFAGKGRIALPKQTHNGYRIPLAVMSDGTVLLAL